MLIHVGVAFATVRCVNWRISPKERPLAFRFESAGMLWNMRQPGLSNELPGADPEAASTAFRAREMLDVAHRCTARWHRQAELTGQFAQPAVSPGSA